MKWGYKSYPPVIQTSANFSTYIFSADITSDILKLCRVTKVKVLFLVVVYLFNFNFFEFSAAILEKGRITMSFRAQGIGERGTRGDVKECKNSDCRESRKQDNHICAVFNTENIIKKNKERPYIIIKLGSKIMQMRCSSCYNQEIKLELKIYLEFFLSLFKTTRRFR